MTGLEGHPAPTGYATGPGAGSSGQPYNEPVPHAGHVPDGADDPDVREWTAAELQAEHRIPADPETAIGVLVPTDAVRALLDALGVDRGDDMDPATFERWREALAAAVPFLERGSYRRGYAIGVRAGSQREDRGVRAVTGRAPVGYLSTGALTADLTVWECAECKALINDVEGHRC